MKFGLILFMGGIAGCMGDGDVRKLVEDWIPGFQEEAPKWVRDGVDQTDKVNDFWADGDTQIGNVAAHGVEGLKPIYNLIKSLKPGGEYSKEDRIKLFAWGYKSMTTLLGVVQSEVVGNIIGTALDAKSLDNFKNVMKSDAMKQVGKIMGKIGGAIGIIGGIMELMTDNNAQMRDISSKLTVMSGMVQMTKHRIHELAFKVSFITKHAMEVVSLRVPLQTVMQTLAIINAHYATFTYYMKHGGEMDKTTLTDFVDSILSRSWNGPINLMKRLRLLVNEKSLDGSPGVLQKMSNYLNEERCQMQCRMHRSGQEILFSFYEQIVQAEMKFGSMLRYAQTQRLRDSEAFRAKMWTEQRTQEAKLESKLTRQLIRDILKGGWTFVFIYLDTSQIRYNCQETPNELFSIMKYDGSRIASEKRISSSVFGCFHTCKTLALPRHHEWTGCDELKDITPLQDSLLQTVEVCVPAAGPEQFESSMNLTNIIESMMKSADLRDMGWFSRAQMATEDIGKHLGKEEQCHDMKSKGCIEIPIPLPPLFGFKVPPIPLFRDDICLGICNNDYYIHIVDMWANITVGNEENMVITGVQFQQKGLALYLIIQHGVLEEYGGIKENSTKWLPSPNVTRSEILTDFGKSYRFIAIVDDLYFLQQTERVPLHVNASFVITGVRFNCTEVIREKEEKIYYDSWDVVNDVPDGDTDFFYKVKVMRSMVIVRIEIQVTSFDYATGKLGKDPKWQAFSEDSLNYSRSFENISFYTTPEEERTQNRFLYNKIPEGGIIPVRPATRQMLHNYTFPLISSKPISVRNGADFTPISGIGIIYRSATPQFADNDDTIGGYLAPVIETYSRHRGILAAIGQMHKTMNQSDWPKNPDF